MIKIAKGEEMPVNTVREGDSSQGHWQLCRVKSKDPKSKGNMTLFLEPPIDGLSDKDTIRINGIVSVVQWNRKTDEGWKEQVSINVDAKKIADAAPDEGFGASDFGGDFGELPF